MPVSQALDAVALFDSAELARDLHRAFHHLLAGGPLPFQQTRERLFLLPPFLWAGAQFLGVVALFVFRSRLLLRPPHLFPPRRPHLPLPPAADRRANVPRRIGQVPAVAAGRRFAQRDTGAWRHDVVMFTDHVEQRTRDILEVHAGPADPELRAHQQVVPEKLLGHLAEYLPGHRHVPFHPAFEYPEHLRITRAAAAL